MRFLEDKEIAEWCTDRGVEVDAYFMPKRLGSARTIEKRSFHSEERSGRRSVAAAMIGALGDWSECLLVVRKWGVWSNSEDWPEYYAARARHQERRSLETAPGHLVTYEERNELIEFVTLVMANGWEADVLPDAGRDAAVRRIFISRDEWCAVEEAIRP